MTAEVDPVMTAWGENGGVDLAAWEEKAGGCWSR